MQTALSPKLKIMPKLTDKFNVFPGGTIELLKQVISSWQVIVITIAIILYLQIVFYAARSYHRPRIKKIKIKRMKPEPAAGPEEIEDGHDSNDDLGLEEDEN